MYKDNRGLWREYITINGKRKFFSAKSKKDLLMKIAKYNIQQKETLTFRFCAEAWKEDNWDRLKFGSLRTYEPCYDRAVEHFGEFNMEEITPKMVQLWLKALAEKYAAKTLGNHKSIVSQVFDYAILSFNAESYNPCDRVKVPSGLRKTTRDALSPSELNEILSTKENEFQLAFLILFTGCRLGEANALKMSDVDFAKKTISISHSTSWRSNQPFIKDPKTESGIRVVPLLPKLEERLKRLNLGAEDYIVSQSPEPLTLSAITRRWESWCRFHGLAKEEKREPTEKNKHSSIWKPTIERHQIRHQYATILYEAGIDPKSAQQLLGHAQIQTTMDVYTHISEAKQKQDYVKLANYIENIG